MSQLTILLKALGVHARAVFWLETAFRLIPIHPDDYELLGMHWQEKFYCDTVLPFGLRSAPYLFNQLSDAVRY